MRPSLTNLPKRARAAAEGSPVPAGQEPLPADAANTPRAGERGSIRRRARRLTRTREVLLRELGALFVEMRRLGRENPELIERKAAQLIAIDEELLGLRTGLDQRQTVERIVAAGVSGSCARCGTLIATDDRFCPHCGLAVAEAPAPGAVSAREAPAEDAPAEDAPADPPPSAGANAGATAPPPPPPPPPPAAEPSAAARPQS